MMQVIKKLLTKIIADIDSGNSNLSESETLEVLTLLLKHSDKEIKLSKYQACQYLNMSRASFDNYVREGLIPKGKKEAGFKELFYIKKDLDAFRKNIKNKLH